MSSDDCYDKAVDLLARRPHFTRELERKLSARGFGSPEIEAALGRLAERGLLDDLECSKGMVEGVWRRRGYGPLRMRAELERRGVESRIIERVLRDSAENELDLAEETARRRLRGSAPSRAALARHLGRKGFSGEIIYEVLNRLDGELGDR